MAENVQIILNDELTINLDELAARSISLDFSFTNFFNFENPIIENNLRSSVTGWNVEIRKAKKKGDANDAYSYITDNWIPNFGYQSRIPCKVVFTRFNITVNDLYLSFSSVRGFQHDVANEIFLFPILSSTEEINEKASNINLKTLWNNPNIDDPLINLKGKITYIRANIPDAKLAAELSFQGLTLFFIGSSLADQTADIVARSSAMLGLGFNAGGLTETGSLAALAIEGALLAVQIAAFIRQVKRFLKDYSDAIFEKPKSYNDVKYFDILEKGTKQLLGNDYSFVSSIFDDNEFPQMYYCAATGLSGVESGEPQNNPLPDTDFLSFLKMTSRWLGNAKFFINTETKVVRYETLETLLDQNTTIFEPQDIEQTGLFTRNLEELITEYNNTYKGDETDLQAKQRNLNVINIIRDNNSNELNQINSDIGLSINGEMMFNLPGRKDRERNAEKALNAIFDTLRSITSFGRKTNFGSRVGYMEMTTDQFSTDKVYIKERGDRIKESTYNSLSLSNIFNTFWPSASPSNYQFLINRGAASRQICDNNVLNNLISEPFFTYQNIDHILTKFQYDQSTDTFLIEYRAKEIYIDGNLITTQTTETL